MIVITRDDCIGHWPNIFYGVKVCVTLIHYPKNVIPPSNSLQDMRQNHRTMKYRSLRPSPHDMKVGVKGMVGWLCWGLTSQSTIFQSYRDGAIASWVSNQYFRGVKCLAQGHNTAAVGFEPRTSRSGVRHSTTEPPRSPQRDGWLLSVLMSSDEISI